LRKSLKSNSPPPLDPLQSAKSARLRYVTGEGPGIVRRRAGKGFTYIGVDAKPVRDKATLQRIKSLAIPPAWENVWICPVENGHIQAAGRDARGRKQYRYHSRYREVRDEAKYGRMLAFGAVLPKIRKKVNEDLAAPGLPQRKVIATVVRFLDETCIRIGNDEYAKSNKSYGLTTLKEQHVDVHGDNVRLRFRGKSKQDHDIKLRDRRLARIVKQLQELPGQELFQYRQDDGEYVKVDSADVNDYLREVTQEDFTAKDFRTWHGSGQMAQELAELGPAQSETEAKRNIVEAVKTTAKRLGNRPAACRKYYIHPAILESYTEQTLFEAMKGVHAGPVRSGVQLRAEELVVMRLVEAYANASSARPAKAS
jgi:DNA topoisomerase-1